MQPASQPNIYGAEQSRARQIQHSGRDTERWNAAWSRWAPGTLKVRRKRLTEDFWKGFFCLFLGSGGSFVLIWFYVRFSFFLFIYLPPRQPDYSEEDANLGVCVKGEKGADKE